MVAFDTGSEAYCGCSLAGCVNRSIKSLLHAFEELRFGDSRVAEKEDVDVSSDSVSSLNYSLLSTKHGHRQCPLDVVMSIDGRSN